MPVNGLIIAEEAVVLTEYSAQDLRPVNMITLRLTGWLVFSSKAAGMTG